MGREILIAHRTEVNGLIAHTYGVLFACPCAFGQNDSHLLTATYGSRGIRTIVVVCFEGLKPKLPAPADIAFGFACIAHKHAAVMANGIGAFRHGRHQVNLCHVQLPNLL